MIIPARNESALIGATVASALRARDRFREAHPDGGDVEVIVVDNRSEDGTARHAARDGVRVATCPDPGAARARNLGARLARGPVLVYLDADTQLPARALIRIAGLVDEGGVPGGDHPPRALDGGRRARFWWGFWNAVRRLPIPRAKAMPACIFCTRDAFERFGPFDERVAIGEEWPILAGLYRAEPRRFVYDRTTTAPSSGRWMELQRFGYARTFARYVWAVLSVRGRVGHPDHARHAAPATRAGGEVDHAGVG